MGLPPFQAQAALVIRSQDPVLACSEAKRLYDILISRLPENVMAHDPQQDRSALVRGKSRNCLVAHGPDRAVVVGAIRHALKVFRAKKDTIVTVSVD